MSGCWSICQLQLCFQNYKPCQTLINPSDLAGEKSPCRFRDIPGHRRCLSLGLEKSLSAKHCFKCQTVWESLLDVAVAGYWKNVVLNMVWTMYKYFDWPDKMVSRWNCLLNANSLTLCAFLMRWMSRFDRAVIYVLQLIRSLFRSVCKLYTVNTSCYVHYIVYATSGEKEVVVCEC